MKGAALRPIRVLSVHNRLSLLRLVNSQMTDG